jgi:ribosomal protein L12E/L44/L45/RPP1/RPP2
VGMLAEAAAAAAAAAPTTAGDIMTDKDSKQEEEEEEEERLSVTVHMDDQSSLVCGEGTGKGNKFGRFT